VAADQHALICILQHSPVLENFTLQLSEVLGLYMDSFMLFKLASINVGRILQLCLVQTPEGSYAMKTTYNLLEQQFASENFKKFLVICPYVDQRVHNILKSLSTYGIPPQKIYIKTDKEII
jgi:hypothetical protein